MWPDNQNIFTREIQMHSFFSVERTRKWGEIIVFALSLDVEYVEFQENGGAHNFSEQCCITRGRGFRNMMEL